MNPSIRRFTLDTNATRSQISIPVTLNDTGRIWHITLTEGGLCYRIEDGCLAVLSVKRPNGSYFEDVCPVLKNVTVVYDFSQNETTAAAEGIHDCEITIFGANKSILTSATFTMVVGTRAVSSDDITLTEDDRTIIDCVACEEAKRQEAEKARVTEFNELMANFDTEYNEVKAAVDSIQKLDETLQENINSELYIGDNVYIRYSEHSDGSDYTEKWSYGQDYIGIAVGKHPPEEKSGYTWRIFLTSENVRTLVDKFAPEAVEEVAPDIVDRVAGEFTTFVRYSKHPDGTDFTDVWTLGQDYIGLAISKEEPTDKSEYKWSSFLADETVHGIVQDVVDKIAEGTIEEIGERVVGEIAEGVVERTVATSVSDVMHGQVVTDWTGTLIKKPWDWTQSGYALVNPNPRMFSSDDIGTYITCKGEDVGDLDPENGDEGKTWYGGHRIVVGTVKGSPVGSNTIRFEKVTCTFECVGETGSTDGPGETIYDIWHDYESYIWYRPHAQWYKLLYSEKLKISGSYSALDYYVASNGGRFTTFSDTTWMKYAEEISPSEITHWRCGYTDDTKVTNEYISTLIYEEAEAVYVEGMKDNHEYRIENLDNIYLTFSPQNLGINDIFNMGIVIKTKGTNPVISWDTGTLYFIGDDCKNGIFFPIRDRIYDMVVWWNGFIYRASVTAALQEVTS